MTSLVSLKSLLLGIQPTTSQYHVMYYDVYISEKSTYQKYQEFVKVHAKE